MRRCLPNKSDNEIKMNPAPLANYKMNKKKCGIKNFAVFASGFGSNLEAIIKAVKTKKIQANLALVVSDKKDAFALARAKKAKIKNIFINPKDFVSKDDYEKAVICELKREKIDFIVLAGFMRILGSQVLNAYKNKILNIHPSLLPAFKGAHAIKDAFSAKVKTTGVTIHFVTKDLDAGPIILQEEIKISSKDTLELLEAKIHKLEHKFYPKAIQLFIQREFI